MKRRYLFLGMGVAIVLMAILAFTYEAPVDVVEDLPPNYEIPWKQALMDDIREAENDEERSSLIEKNSLRLSASLVSFMRTEENYRCPVPTFEYRFGTGRASNVRNWAGGHSDGPFTNQVYTVFSPEDECELIVLTKCYNIMETAKTVESIPLGVAKLDFEIEEGKSLYDYVDDETASRIGQIFNLPIEDGLILTSPGDKIDLGQMTYNGTPAQG